MADAAEFSYEDCWSENNATSAYEPSRCRFVKYDRGTHVTAGTSAGPDRLETVTAATFSEFVLQGQGPIVVEFMSYGCAHCRAIEPVIQEVAAMLVAQESFYRVNSAVETDLSSSYGIEGTPTLIFFLNGSEISRVEGPVPSTKSLFNAVTQPFSK